MPAKSQAQLNLMRIALAYKKGKIKRASAAAKHIAKTMTYKELKDFLDVEDPETLPQHVEHLDEEFATLDATPGMGAVTPPSADTTGSGDTFSSYGLYTQMSMKKTRGVRKKKKAKSIKKYKPKKGIAITRGLGTVVHFNDFIKGLEGRNNNQFTDHNTDMNGSILGGTAGSDDYEGFDDGDAGGDGGD